MSLVSLFAACSGPIQPGTETGASDPPPREWVGVTALPCGIDAEGFVECWGSEEWAAIHGEGDALLFAVPPPSPFPIRDGIVFTDSATVSWGVRADVAEADWWTCAPGDPDLDANVFCFDPPDLPFDAIGQNFGLVGGRIEGWGYYTDRSFPERSDYTHIAGDFSYTSASIAALSADNAVHFVIGESPPTGYAFSPGFTVETFVAFDDYNACGLDASGVIECIGTVPAAFDHPPYRMMSGGGRVVCAAREDWTIECTDGSTFDYGPLRDMVATTHLTYYWDDSDPLVGPRWRPDYDQTRADPPHLCVVTEANAIECSGWRYDFDDLQARLPDGE